MSVTPRPLPARSRSRMVEVGAVSDFDEFYRTQYSMVVRLLFGMTGRWALAEELTQEAMLATHRRWSKVRHFDRPDQWLRRVAMNRAISAHRRVLAEAAVLVRMRSTAVEAIPDHTNVDDAVWHSLAKLPRRQAAALVLSAVDDRSFDEIGHILGCSTETARTHVRRARERLKVVLSKETS